MFVVTHDAFPMLRGVGALEFARCVHGVKRSIIIQHVCCIDGLFNKWGSRLEFEGKSFKTWCIILAGHGDIGLVENKIKGMIVCWKIIFELCW